MSKYEDAIFQSKIDAVKAMDALLENATLTESIISNYIKRRDKYADLIACANANPKNEVLQEAVKELNGKADYNYYNKLLDAQYKKVLSEVKKNVPTKEYDKYAAKVTKKYGKAKKYFEKMKTSEDIGAKITKFFGNGAMINQGKVAEVMHDYLTLEFKDKSASPFEKKDLKKAADKEKNKKTMGKLMNECAALDELDEFVVEVDNEHNPFTLIESAHDSTNPFDAARMLIEAADILANSEPDVA